MTIGTSPSRDNPGVVVFPPALFGGALLAGLLLQWFSPWRLHLQAPVRVTALGLVLVAAAVLALWGKRAMHRAGTNVHPGKPSTTIVTNGPFRYSRNPLYLSLLGLYAGVALAVDTVWLFVLVLPLLLVLDYGIIRREERYLEAKFGDLYRTYKTKVRRWL